MCVVSVIKETRETLGLNQKNGAQALGVAHSTYLAYENKVRPMPDDIVLKAAQLLKNPRIIAEYTYEKQTEFFNVPVLDMAEDYPFVVMDSLIEEGCGMVYALSQIKKSVKNKKDQSQLSPEETMELEDHEEHVGDVYVTLKMHFISIGKYGVDIKRIEKRCNRKLINKGYVSGNRYKKSALA